MNLRTTIILACLVFLAGAWLWRGPELARRANLLPPITVLNDGSSEVLSELKPDAVQRLELITSAGEQLVLSRIDNRWAMPGGWPVRQQEVDELVQRLCSLRTRFAPIPLGTSSQKTLETYGLGPNDRPVTVVLHRPGRDPLTLRFGQPIEEGMSPLEAPVYLRVGEKVELVKLGPDLRPLLNREPESYRRRQLFPDTERVVLRLPAPPPPPFNPMNPLPPPPSEPQIVVQTLFRGEAPSNTTPRRYRTLELRSPAGNVLLRCTGPTPKPPVNPDAPAGEPALPLDQLADTWEIVEPVRDRLDPEQLRNLRAALGELWVVGFGSDYKTWPELIRLPFRREKPMTRLQALALLGLGDDAATIGLTQADGTRRFLRVGKIAPRRGFDPEQRYALLEGDSRILLIEAQPLFSIFSRIDKDPFSTDESPQARTETTNALLNRLRDPRVSRFEPNAVTAVTIQRPNGERVVLEKSKGDPNAREESERLPKWFVRRANGERLLAEGSRVTELLDSLAKAEALPSDIIEKLPRLPFLGDPTANTDTVTLTLGEQTQTFFVSSADATRKTILVRAQDRERWLRVADRPREFVARNDLAYRSQRPWDLSVERITAIEVGRADETWRIDQTPGDSKWTLTQPTSAEVDSGRVSETVRELASVRVGEYVKDFADKQAMTNEALTPFGLERPAARVTIFRRDGKEPDTFTIGSTVPMKEEFYARRLDGTTVFTLPKKLVEGLLGSSLSLRPTQLWTYAPNLIRTIQVIPENGKEFTLRQAIGAWQVSAPFDAPAAGTDLQNLSVTLGNLRAERYEAHTSADLKKFGLDKPALTLRLTVEGTAPAGTSEPKIETAELRIGAAGKPGERFAMLPSKPGVFVIKDDLFVRLNVPALSFLDRTLLTLKPDELTRLEIRNGSETIELQRINGRWQALDKLPLDQQTITELTTKLASLTASRLEAYGVNHDPAPYDLASPKQSIRIDAGSLTKTLRVGKIADEQTKSRFVALEGSPAIAVLPGETITALLPSKPMLADRNLLRFNKEELEGIRRKLRDGGDLEIRLQGIAWRIVKPQALPADERDLNDLAARLSELRAETITAIDPPNLGEFGLQPPFATITLERVDQTGKPILSTLYLGAVDPKSPTGARFAYLEPQAGEPKRIALLPATLTAELTKPPLDYRERTLAKFVQADRIELKRPDRELLVFSKLPEGWKLIAPVVDTAEDVGLRDIHDSVALFRPASLVTDGPAPLPQYGLDKPVAEWKFLSDGKPVLHFLVGRPDKDGNVFGKLTTGPMIFRFEPQLAAKLVAEYRQRRIWPALDASQAESLTIARGSAKLVFRKNAMTGEWSMDGLSRDEVLNVPALNETLSALDAPMAERYVADKNPPRVLFGLASPPRVELTLQTKAGTRTLYLGGREGGATGKHVYAALPPGREPDSVFVLSELDTRRLDRERKDFVLAAKKK